MWTPRVIDSLKIKLAPFLPFTAQQLHHYLGYDGQVFGDRMIQTYEEFTPRDHVALTYDSSKVVSSDTESTSGWAATA
ncbi:MAG: hypothetical protein U0528_15370 [Anaerolineae bacterium]